MFICHKYDRNEHCNQLVCDCCSIEPECIERHEASPHADARAVQLAQRRPEQTPMEVAQLTIGQA